MFHFIGRWLSDCVHVSCMLAAALLAMQIPALTHAYLAGLVQVAEDGRRDVDRRENDARQYYHLAPDSDDQAVIVALRPVEPSNAATLVVSVARVNMFRNTYTQIIGSPSVSRPIVAVWDAVQHPETDKLAVLRTSIATYVPQIALDASSAVYGIAGLLLGGLIGHIVTDLPRALWHRIVGRREAETVL